MFCWADTEQLLAGLDDATGIEKIELLLELAKEAQAFKLQDAIEFGNNALKLAREINSKKHEVESMISISESCRRNGEYDKSKLLGNNALSLAEKLQDNLLISKALVNIAHILIAFNDFRTAFDTSSQLLKMNYNKNNEFVGAAYWLIGWIFREIGNYEKAIDYHLKALDFFKNEKKYFEYQYTIITHLGLDYRYLGNDNKSLEYFNKLLELIPQKETFKYGRALNRIGVTYLIMENYEKALDYCEQALQFYQIENKRHKMGNIYNDLARIYFLKGNHQKALEFNILSLNKRRELNLTHLVASSYRNLADNYLDSKDYVSSEEYYLKSLVNAEKMNNLIIPLYVHEKMARMYEEQQKYASALESNKKYLKLYKNSQNKKLQTKMLNEQYNLEITVIEQENSLLRKSNTNLNHEVQINKKIRSTLLYVLALVFIILVIALIIYYDKKRYSNMLEIEVDAKTRDLNNSRMVLKNIGTEKEMLTSEMMNLRYSYENLVQNLGEGIGIISNEDEFLAVNPAAEKIFGIRSKDLVGRNLKEFIISEELNVVQDNALQKINCNISTYEITIKRPKGEKRNIIITATPITNKEGKIISILSIFRDITERIIDENKIKEMLRKNITLVQELEHRVKNNLQLIYSIAGMLAHSSEDEKTNITLKRLKSLIYVISLTHDVRLPENKNIIDFQRYINFIFSNLYTTLPNCSKHVKFENETLFNEININYAAPLGMIISELISNSLAHAFATNQNNIISLKYSRINDENVLVYSDNGIGMDNIIEISNCESFGLQIIYLQSRKLKGNLEINTTNGFYLKLSFKDINLKTFTKV